MTASSMFSDADRAAVARAIEDAEKTTGAEIVPVVATRSGVYDRAEDLVGVALVILAAGTAFAFPLPPWAVFALPLGLLALFWAGVGLARACPPLVRLLSTARMEDAVLRASAESFERFHVRSTRAATGLVIYVSLFERAVCVLADEGIESKIADAEWDAIERPLADAIRAGRPADGLVRAVAAAGTLLARHVPRAADDRNELANELRLVD